jgi:hypothetical protein
LFGLLTKWTFIQDGERMEKIQLEYRGRGPLQNNEDWYYLVFQDDGSISVEHEWQHMNPYKGTTTSEGTESFDFDEFRASANGIRLSAQIDAALKARGLS